MACPDRTLQNRLLNVLFLFAYMSVVNYCKKSAQFVTVDPFYPYNYVHGLLPAESKSFETDLPYFFSLCTAEAYDTR